MEVRSRVIAEAIENGALPYGREDGKTLKKGDRAAPERRAVLGRDLRDWMIREFPNDKPAFLFDDIERNSHTAISADAYRALKAENEKLEGQLETERQKFGELRDEKARMEVELTELRQQVSGQDVPGERSKATYLNIIAALIEVIAGACPGVERHPSFISEAKLISLIDEKYRGYPGLSKSNLHRKFPEAKQSLTDH